jgi:hypothetical protein
MVRAVDEGWLYALGDGNHQVLLTNQVMTRYGSCVSLVPKRAASCAANRQPAFQERNDDYRVSQKLNLKTRPSPGKAAAKPPHRLIRRVCAPPRQTQSTQSIAPLPGRQDASH